MNEETKKRLEGWSKQLGVSLEELNEEYETRFKVATVAFAEQELSEVQIEIQVRKAMGNKYRPGRSKSLTYEGIILGFTQVKDWNDYQINANKRAFEENSMETIAQGLTNETGVPLVTSEFKEKKGKYFDKEIGDIIPNEYERRVLAIARPVVVPEGEPNPLRIFHITLKGEPSLFKGRYQDGAVIGFPAPAVGQVSRWRCNVQDTNPDHNWTRAYGATVTAFEKSTLDTGKEVLEGIIKPKKCAGILNQVNDIFKIEDPSQLREWMEENTKVKGHFAVFTSEIMAMYKTGFRLGDADQQDLENIPNVFLKIDGKVVDQMRYGEDSTVVVACEPYEQKVRKDGKVVMDENKKPVKEITGDCLSVFPIIISPVSVPAPKEEAKSEEPKSETEIEI